MTADLDADDLSRTTCASIDLIQLNGGQKFVVPLAGCNEGKPRPLHSHLASVFSSKRSFHKSILY